MSEKSLDHYIQEATSLLAAETFTPQALRASLPLSRVAGSLLLSITSFPSPAAPTLPLTFVQRSKLQGVLRRTP